MTYKYDKGLSKRESKYQNILYKENIIDITCFLAIFINIRAAC